MGCGNSKSVVVLNKNEIQKNQDQKPGNQMEQQKQKEETKPQETKQIQKPDTQKKEQSQVQQVQNEKKDTTKQQTEQGKKHNQQKKFQAYCRMKFDSNTLQIFKFNSKALTNEKINGIKNLSKESTSLIQTSDNQIILAGGQNEETFLKDIVKITDKSIEKIELKYPKIKPSLAFNNNNLVFIIAGLDSQSKCTNNSECFNITNNEQKIITPHPHKIYRNGACYVYETIITFGGADSLLSSINYVCQYDIMENK